MLSAGWTTYPVASWPSNLLPPWMAGLWLGFCTTLNVSLRWLRNHLAIASVFGMVGGPIAYGSGVKLGAMTWMQPMYVLATVSIGFGLFLPLLLKLSEHLDGYATDIMNSTSGSGETRRQR
jgi:hypothetical protein